MSTRKDTAEAKSDTGSPTVLVLLCQNLAKSAPWLDINIVISGLSSSQEKVQVRLLDDLCHQLQAAEIIIEQSAAPRLVLGLCSADRLGLELQAQARSAGIDPLGVQVVDLIGSWDNKTGRGGAANDWAKVVLAAAVARARAFPGSRPENLKAVLLSSRQKVSRRTLFTLPPLSYVSVPTINQSQCRAEDGCDQCVSACPQRALEKDASTILVSRVQCQSCGSCVAACPQRAVELPGWSAEEREAQLSSLLESEPRQGTRAVAFVCQNAANLAGAGWLPVRIPCTSSVSASELLTSLAHGANRVAVYSCGAMCATGLNEAVRGRVSYCQELLRVLGDTSATERVQFLNPDDGGSAKPVTLLPTLPGETPNNPMNLFGNGAAAKAVIELTARYGAQSLTLEHPHSPLGLVGIDASTCTGCDTCVVACPTGALFSERSDQGPTINFDPALCIGCGKCVTSCPEQAADAIDMSPTTDLLQISQGPKSLFQGREVRCRRCEAPVATREMLNRIATLLGDEYIPEYMEKLCVDCRGRS